MTKLVIAVLVLAVVNVAYKALGPAILGDREFPPRIAAAVDALPAALLAGLLTVDLLGQGWRGFDWTLLPGLGLAFALRALRRSHLTCIIAAVAGTALLRALL